MAQLPMIKPDCERCITTCNHIPPAENGYCEDFLPPDWRDCHYMGGRWYKEKK